MAWRRGVVGISVCGMLSCSASRVPRIGEGAPALSDSVAEVRYQDVLARHTRKAAVYDGLDTRIFVAVTQETPVFAQARSERMAQFLDVPEEEARAAWVQERERIAANVEFFFGVHANEPRFDDFDRPQSMWRFTLTVGGVSYAPTRIERVGKVHPNLQAVYCYLDTFWVGYRVQFDKAAAEPGKPMRLRLASAVGRADLEFSPWR